MSIKNFVAALAALFLAAPAAAQTVATVVSPVPPALEAENMLHLDLSTGGRVTIQLRPDAAPNHVERYKLLARRGFYDGLVFHRVIEGFMAQGGDPAGDGSGGSELPDLVAEFNTLPHVRGALSAARTDEPNTANSQFFIMLVPRLTLDRKYTVFGRVVSGMNFVDEIVRGEPPAHPTIIVKASIGSDNVSPLDPATLAAAVARPRAAPVPPPASPPAPDTAAAPDAAPAAPAPVVVAPAETPAALQPEAAPEVSPEPDAAPPAAPEAEASAEPQSQAPPTQ